MQHQQHVEDKEEIMSVPEDVIVRNSEKTNNLVSMSFSIPSDKKDGASFHTHAQLNKIMSLSELYL